MYLVSASDQIVSLNDRHALSITTGQVSPTAAARTSVGPEKSVERGRLAVILVKLLDDADEAIYCDREAARACIARASALLRDDLDHEHAPENLVRGGLAPWQIARVRAHVETHLHSTIRMRDLTAIARLSTGHFSRSFTRSLGVAPFAYIAERRLARAQVLMLTTDDPLSQIALACGLYDQSHLTRLFRRHVGTSPNAWRRRHKAEPDAPLPAPSAPGPRPGHPAECARPHQPPLLAIG